MCDNRTTWEHCVIAMWVDGDPARHLDLLGKQGWALAGVCPVALKPGFAQFYFKRPGGCVSMSNDMKSEIDLGIVEFSDPNLTLVARRVSELARLCAENHMELMSLRGLMNTWARMVMPEAEGET